MVPKMMQQELIFSILMSSLFRKKKDISMKYGCIFYRDHKVEGNHTGDFELRYDEDENHDRFHRKIRDFCYFRCWKIFEHNARMKNHRWLLEKYSYQT